MSQKQGSSKKARGDRGTSGTGTRPRRNRGSQHKTGYKGGGGGQRLDAGTLVLLGKGLAQSIHLYHGEYIGNENSSGGSRLAKVSRSGKAKFFPPKSVMYRGANKQVIANLHKVHAAS